MTFFPILKAPGCTGFTTVHNYGPNNWQEGSHIQRYLNVSWTDGSCWHTRHLAQLRYGESCTINSESLSDITPENSTPFLSLTDLPSPLKSDNLSINIFNDSSLPNWRASIGLLSSTGQSTCYQGDIEPFPSTGSLLTFGHLFQPGTNIFNYLLLLNLEISPLTKSSVLEVRNSAQPGIIISSHQVFSNMLNVIPIDSERLHYEDLPLIVCRGMSGIPLYFSCTKDMNHLSLEHTHPPASYAVLGNRREAQKIMKKFWFSKLE